VGTTFSVSLVEVQFLGPGGKLESHCWYTSYCNLLILSNMTVYVSCVLVNKIMRSWKLYRNIQQISMFMPMTIRLHSISRQEMCKMRYM
jgi:hypothetical protein